MPRGTTGNIKKKGKDEIIKEKTFDQSKIKKRSVTHLRSLTELGSISSESKECATAFIPEFPRLDEKMPGFRFPEAEPYPRCSAPLPGGAEGPRGTAFEL